MTGTIRVLVVDDHPVFRHGLTALFSTEADIEVVGEAADGPGAVAQALRTAPDVVVMDLNLGDHDGVTAIAELTAQLPATRVLVLSMHDDQRYVRAALRAGAAGYLRKETASSQVSPSVRLVAAGQEVFSKGVCDRLLAESSAADGEAGGAPLPPLTTRERTILDELARGRNPDTIARHLGIRPKTVRNNLTVIYSKLQVPDRAAAVLAARAAGLGAGAR